MIFRANATEVHELDHCGVCLKFNLRRRVPLFEEKQEKTLLSLSEFTLHRDFISAYKVMTFIKQHNLLYKTLNDDDTEQVRQFFETELSRPSYRVSAKVMRLMHEAFNKCWERVIDVCEKADFTNEAKACFLDVMLIFPDLIPEFWGGRHIGLAF
ncbi:unnamed protein product [Cylicostephanus goldi]|uniref:DUF7774 domain-containing protein n=1 Tax=Cylicostephanus goldi TaxID=71465 RepID=A0A3P6R2N0_CYLGO|nr:unnamed protein product [Cylicostephanus goldi]